jgi:enoyl-CoA hydratase
MRTERENPAIPEVVLDHPPVNALRSEDFLALAETVTMLGRDPATRVIILRSDVEKAFAAGVDVHEMTEGGPRAVVAVTRAVPRPRRDRRVRGAVVAACARLPPATGVGLAGNADVIVASDDAVFGSRGRPGRLGTATQLHSPFRAQGAVACLLLRADPGDRAGALRHRRARRAARGAARLRA